MSRSKFTFIIILLFGFAFFFRKRWKESDEFRAGFIELYYEMSPIDANSTVFIGNSLTEQFPLHRLFDNQNIKNRGIGGQSVNDIERRIDVILRDKPQKIFLMIGINDLLRKQPFDSIKASYLGIFKKIYFQSPKTKLYVQSVLPTGQEAKAWNPDIRKFNGWLQNECLARKVSYIELYSSFYNGQELNPMYTTDGLHLNLKGYQVWKRQIEPYVVF